MSSNPKSFSRKSRRPKAGSSFLLVRLVGWFFNIGGGLLIGSAVLGFIVMLPKVIPIIADAWQYLPENKMAGLVLIGGLSWVLAFLILGLAGVILVGIGFAFSRWGTEPVNTFSNQLPTAGTPAQPG